MNTLLIIIYSYLTFSCLIFLSSMIHDLCLYFSTGKTDVKFPINCWSTIKIHLMISLCWLPILIFIVWVKFEQTRAIKKSNKNNDAMNK